jgi:hypothetical protein
MMVIKLSSVQTIGVDKGSTKSGEIIISEKPLSLLNCVQYRVHSGTRFRGPDTAVRSEQPPQVNLDLHLTLHNTDL